MPTLKNVNLDNIVKHTTDHVIKPSQDKRLYRGYELHNGLKIMLISDEHTDKSAASLDICVGSLSDPQYVPGLAHFCEHMLFMGTEKYPVENDYGNYLALHGGYTNAYTADDHTNYHFDVAPESLGGAIDRFANFFISPLFNADSLEREVMAVDSEYSNALQNDNARLNYLVQAASKPGHVYAQFGWGNRVSLWEMCEAPPGVQLDPREQLLKFYDRYYSSNLMTLVVLGKENLNDLASMVLPLFAQVPNKSLTRSIWQDHPYTKTEMAKKLYAVPLKDLKMLRLTFATPDLTSFYRSKPGDYVSHLLGHEGKGSLLYELKERSWANNLSACQETVAHGFGLFKIDIELSNDGLKNVDPMIELVFQYINSVIRQPPQTWIFEEMQKLYDINFTYQDQRRPEDAVTCLAPFLHDYTLEESLIAPHYLLTEFDPVQISKLVDMLKPENMLVSIVSKEYEGKTDQLEKWFQVHYSVENIEKSLIDRFSHAVNVDCFLLPKANQFIPSKFDLHNTSTPEVTCWPAILKDEPDHRCWFKQDDEFKMPKSCLKLNFRSPVAYSTPAQFVRTHLLVELIKDSMSDYAYDAMLAGLAYGLRNDAYGIKMDIEGFDEKQTTLTLKLIDTLVSLNGVDSSRFEVLKEKYVRNLKNFAKKQPYEQARLYIHLLLMEKYWKIDELLKEAEVVNFVDVEQHKNEFFTCSHLEILVHGNTSKTITQNVLDSIKVTVAKHVSIKPICTDQLRRMKTIKLNEKKSCVLEIINGHHANSTMVFYLQTNLEHTKSNMLTELLEQIINEQYFDQLRTKEQLGYIVSSQVKNFNGVRGIYFVIQGGKSPLEFEERTESFIASLEQILNKMPKDEFDEHKESLATIRLDKPKNLSQLCEKFWAEIVNNQYKFDRDNLEVEALRKISKNDLIKFYKENISAGGSKRRKLSIHMYGTDANKAKKQKTNDVVTVIDLDGVCEFKRSLPLFDNPEPYKIVERNGSASEANVKKGKL